MTDVGNDIAPRICWRSAILNGQILQQAKCMDERGYWLEASENIVSFPPASCSISTLLPGTYGLVSRLRENA
jgi:hypothetical protein